MDLIISDSQTICALATPPGRGAIGVIRISGAQAATIVSTLCPGVKLKARRLQHAVAVAEDGQEPLDELMVAWMPGPRSYTGEDVVELFAHGGELNLSRLLQRCVALGAQPAQPGEFTRRAFINGRIDLTQAEAVAALIDARSTRALRNAQALLAGELGRRVARLRGEMLSLVADLEACIDFADDHEAPVADGALEGAFTGVKETLRALLQSYDRRGALAGISVALVGAVNAGKSSLFNALLGQRRALVSEEEGTTRDFIEAQVEWSGLRVTLVDTAGARPAEQMSALEQAGYSLGEERVARCDLRVGVIDATEEVTRWPAVLVGRCELFVASKGDLIDPGCRADVLRRLVEWGRAPALAVLLQQEHDLQALRAALLSLALPAEGEGERFHITEERQWSALQRAQQAVDAGFVAWREGLPPEVVVEPLRRALRVLGELMGEEYSEQVLDLVFSRFCVGK